MSLTLLLAGLCVALTCSLTVSLYLHARSNDRWMRLFSEKQGISFELMEGQSEEKPKPVPPKPVKKMSIPIPGSEFFKKAAR